MYKKKKCLGAIKKQDGYRRIHLGDGVWEWEHRLVLQVKLGRPLRPGMISHHINRDKLDNRPENLIEVTRREHSDLHPETKEAFALKMKSLPTRYALCHPDRKHASDGLCRQCKKKEYKRRYKENHPDVVRERTRLRKLNRRVKLRSERSSDWTPKRSRHWVGVVGEAHPAWKGGPKPHVPVPRKKRLVRVPDCHPDRVHGGRGLCRACYQLSVRMKNGQKPKETRKMSDCHPARVSVAGSGMCRQCLARKRYEQNKLDPAFLEKTRAAARDYYRARHGIVARKERA